MIILYIYDTKYLKNTTGCFFQEESSSGVYLEFTTWRFLLDKTDCSGKFLVWYGIHLSRLYVSSGYVIVHTFVFRKPTLTRLYVIYTNGGVVYIRFINLRWSRVFIHVYKCSWYGGCLLYRCCNCGGWREICCDGKNCWPSNNSWSCNSWKPSLPCSFMGSRKLSGTLSVRADGFRRKSAFA